MAHERTEAGFADDDVPASLTSTLARPSPAAPEAPASLTSTLGDAPAVATPATLTRGDSVGRYVITGQLGQGGMGVVFAAYDPELDRKVALKLLLAADTASLLATDARTRLTREAQALAQLAHPNVVAIFDVGTLGHQVWIAMEFIDGQTLGDWTRAHKPGWQAVVDVFRSAAEGLQAAHAAGLVHRDFKPKSRRPSPTAPQPTDRPHSHDLGRFERVDVCRGVPRSAGAPQILAKGWQEPGAVGDTRGQTLGSCAPAKAGTTRPPTVA